jgi:hypothetical protein
MIRLSIRPLSPIWKHRAFRRSWGGETISLTGSSLSMFALPLVVVVALRVAVAYASERPSR